MDVTCNRCGASYEFEAGLVSTTGMTVKCTQCGHLFKVQQTAPPGRQAISAREASVATESNRWRVRRKDGSIHTLDSLTELTKLIAAGQFSHDDEISRTGQLWRKLGDINEFSPLLHTGPRTRTSTIPPPVPSRAPAAATPPDNSESIATHRMRRITPTEQRIPAPAALPETQDRASPLPALPQQVARSAPTSSAARASSTAAPLPPFDPGSLLPVPASPTAQEIASAESHIGRRSRVWPWLLGVVMLIALAAGITGKLIVRPAPPTPVQSSTLGHLVNGDRAFATHRPERFEEAIAHYKRALAAHPDDAHLLSSISRVYAVWSQLLRDEVDALPDDGDTAASAATRAEIVRLADQARHYGERAAQRNPGNQEAGVALSDALRLLGNLVAARAEIDRARQTEGSPPAEMLRVSALLAIDETKELRAGRALAQQAVAQEPMLLRAQLLLARCLAAEGDLVGALVHLDAVREIDSAHPLLATIEREMRALASPAKEQAVPTPTQAPAQPTEGEAEPADPSADSSATSGGTGSVHFARQGEAALENGATQTAQRAFEQALKVDPQMARARSGLGYVALERSEPLMAINHFRPAAKQGYAEAWIGLGEAYRRLGRTKDALETYQSYLKRFPRGARRSIAERQVELLSAQLQENP